MVISHVLQQLVCRAACHSLPHEEQTGQAVACCEAVSQLTAFLLLPAPLLKLQSNTHIMLRFKTMI